MTFEARRLTRLALFVFGMPAALYSQLDTATLRGTVYDSSGQPVPHVAVTITDARASYTRSLTTDAGGSWAAPLLPPGVYRVKIEERGYQKYSAENVLLEPNQVRRLDAVIQTGTPEEAAPTDVGPAAAGTQEGAVRAILDFRTLMARNALVEKRPFGSAAGLTPTPGVQGVDRNRQGLVDRWRPRRLDRRRAQPSAVFRIGRITTADGAADISARTLSAWFPKRGGNDLHWLPLYYKLEASVLDAKPPTTRTRIPIILGEAGFEAGGAVIKDWTFFLWRDGSARPILITSPYTPTCLPRRCGLHDFSQYLDPKTSPTGPGGGHPRPQERCSFSNNVIPLHA